ncbi:MAG: hypothetical protein JO332_08340 [Planctomycetaceae bacterium]|nr:hypothetical protein [Planctomycetaceae bacterium]
MGSLLAVVSPGLETPGAVDPGTALGILAALGLLSAAFVRLCAALDRQVDRIAGEVGVDLPRPDGRRTAGTLDPFRTTGILLVTGYNRFGLRALLEFWKGYRDCFGQILIVGIDPGGRDPVRLRQSLDGYLSATAAMGLDADLRIVPPADDPVSEAERACLRLVERFRAVVFCSGRIEPRPGRWVESSLPDSICDQVRRRLRRRGLPETSLPVRVEMKKAAAEAAAFPD